MSDRISVDAVVIGGGLAGMSAGVRMAQLGIKVLVLEAGAEASYLCATRYTGGLFHVAMDDALADPAVVRANLERATAGTTAPALADALVKNTRRAIDWLKLLGVRFIGAGPEGFRRNALAPPGMRQTGTKGNQGQPYWVGRSGDTLLRTLEDQLRSNGGTLRRGVRGRSLLMDSGRCVGVMAEQAGQPLQITAHGTVIADGGFQSNEELMRRFVTNRPDRLLQRNAQSGQGDGLRMAEAVGANLVGMDRFYGHMCYREAITDERFWPYPILDSLCTAGIVVDADGRRFCDEGLGGVYITNQTAKLADPMSASVIFDRTIWEGPGRDWVLPPNPYLLTAGGRMLTANTLEELATLLGIDPASLVATVAGYNAALTGDSPLSPARTATSVRPWPIVQAPFHAFGLVPGITYAMGGIETNERAQVLNEQGVPIPGLYAAGACTGGLEGGGHAGYSGGLTKSSVFGMLAAEAIAADASGSSS